MKISTSAIEACNEPLLKNHKRQYDFFASSNEGAELLIKKMAAFQVAIPSWALGNGGTRFGRFPGKGEPSNLEQKIEDVGLLHSLNQSGNAISLHIPWDIPSDYKLILAAAAEYGIRFDAMNSNTFQDQPGQHQSYKFGSLQHTDKAVRQLAIDHNKEVIQHGIKLGSKALTVWLSDGSCFPGQLNFRQAFQRVLEGLQDIYSTLPAEWKMFVEYKPYEPNFYSTTVGDWGQSLLYANKLGPQAHTLVDLGHHLPNTNIEQIVSLLLMEKKLGGFHFNDSKYGDDDLTVGSIKPYQLFLIFNELIEGMDAAGMDHATGLAWMIDASHNVKDPLEDLLQSVEAILISYAQALLVDRKSLQETQQNNDVVKCQELLQAAFRTDVRPLIAEASLSNGGAISPIEAFRKLKVRDTLIKERGTKAVATGL